MKKSLALTISGTVKVRTLNGQEDKTAANLENESKQIRSLNVWSCQQEWEMIEIFNL